MFFFGRRGDPAILDTDSRKYTICLKKSNGLYETRSDIVKIRAGIYQNVYIDQVNKEFIVNDKYGCYFARKYLFFYCIESGFHVIKKITAEGYMDNAKDFFERENITIIHTIDTTVPEDNILYWTIGNLLVEKTNLNTGITNVFIDICMEEYEETTANKKYKNPKEIEPLVEKGLIDDKFLYKNVWNNYFCFQQDVADDEIHSSFFTYLYLYKRKTIAEFEHKKYVYYKISRKNHLNGLFFC